MKTFFKELFQYNQHANQIILASLLLNREKGAGSSIKFFNHIINVHQIWNGRIQPAGAPPGAWEINSIDDLFEMDNRNLVASLQILDDFELERVIRYANSKGQIYHHMARDLLFHIINHSTYHRGQIAIEFRQNGIEPVSTDYIFYKWK
jgi:uncharacterized damage-inducible protein DinB